MTGNNGRVRVLHVCDKFGIHGATVHGVTRLLSWWFPRWNKDEFDCRLVGLRAFDASAQFLVDRGTLVHCLDKGKLDPSTLTALMRLIRNEKIDIIHLHGYAASDFGRLAASRAGIPAIIHEHFVDPAMPRYQRVVDRLLARKTRIGIAVSRSVLEFMATERHIPRERLRLIGNGAPIADFAAVDAATARATRDTWRIPANKPVIGVIGRLNTQKGITYLIQALPLLARHGLEATLVIIGDGNLRPSLEAEAAALGVAGQVVFTGFADDTRTLQTLLDIQLFPSLFEGTPLTLFEAMAMSRPIVSTGVDGLGEVLVDGETALMVPPRDPRALADAVAHLLQNPDEAARLARNAKAASGAYDIQNAVDAIQNVYREALGSPATATAVEVEAGGRRLAEQ